MPPWYWLSRVDIAGRFLLGGRCEVTVRGDVALRFTAPAEVSRAQQSLDDPGTYVVTCGAPGPTTGDRSRVTFVIDAAEQPARLAPGRYRVTAERPWGSGPAGRTASALATLYPDPRDASEWRDYESGGGQLMVAAAAPTGERDGQWIAGTFRIRARRYVRFG